MGYFKPINQLKKEARDRLTADDIRLSAAKDLRFSFGEQAAEMQAELNITDVLSEAALAGKVEFGIKPKISVLLDVFDKYTAMWELMTNVPIKKINSIVLPPEFALSLLMKSLLKGLGTIEQKYYPNIGALPWEDDFRYLNKDMAEDYLKAFCNTPAGIDIMPKLGSPEISDSLQDYLLHCSFTKNKRITVGDIVDWALSKLVLERDLK